jgi:hypothetical protein
MPKTFASLTSSAVRFTLPSPADEMVSLPSWRSLSARVEELHHGAGHVELRLARAATEHPARGLLLLEDLEVRKAQALLVERHVELLVEEELPERVGVAVDLVVDRERGHVFLPKGMRSYRGPRPGATGSSGALARSHMGAASGAGWNSDRIRKPKRS